MIFIIPIFEGSIKNMSVNVTDPKVITGIYDKNIIILRPVYGRQRYKCGFCGYDTENKKRYRRITAPSDIIMHLAIEHTIDYRIGCKIAKKRQHYLKPWKDPESLFCDTVFLEEYIKKSVARGDECKDEV